MNAAPPCKTVTLPLAALRELEVLVVNQLEAIEQFQLRNECPPIVRQALDVKSRELDNLRVILNQAGQQAIDQPEQS